MSTNYYVKTGKFETVVCNYGCKHEIEEKLHIGKYSNGWKFCLHIIPEKNINSLEDWKKILKDGYIFDEYHSEISYDEMIKTIVGDYVDNGVKHLVKDDGSYKTMYDPNDNLHYTSVDTLGKDGSYILVEGEFF